MIGPGIGWWLSAARLFALLRAQAAPRLAAGPVWTVLSAVLALLLAPLLASRAGPLPRVDGLEFLVAIGLELLLGAVLGAFVALAGHALVGGAQVSAEALMPGASRGAFVLLTVCLGLGLGLGLGVHHPLLAALADLGGRFPVGDPGRWLTDDAGPWAVAAAARSATVLALGLATPVLLVHLVVDLFTGLAAGRSGPTQVTTQMVGAWSRLALCLLALGAAWLTFPEAWGRGWGLTATLGS